MIILGISAYYHDSAACIIKNEKIIAAAQEERFTRVKHDSNFPTNSIKFCIEVASIQLDEVDYIVFYEKPFLKFERILETYLYFAPKGFRSFCKSLPVWIKEKLFQKKIIINELNNICSKKIDWSKKLLFNEHHLSHAASAFFPSPFEKALILTIDGVGEWTTCSVGIGDKNKISILKEIKFPHSLGLLYSAFTYFLGFKVNSGEYKVMGLAPYGKPKYTDLIKNNLIEILEDGSFKLNMKYFDYCTNLKMTNVKFNKLFEQPPRKSESKLTQKDMDIAASIQKVVEEVILKIVKKIKLDYKIDNLCLSGGVALNCVANSKILREKLFEKIWVQPASGDAGGALGAAMSVYYLMKNKERSVESGKDKMNGSLLGPQFTSEDIVGQLKSLNATYLEMKNNNIIDEVAKYLSAGKAVGWMSGRSEFGPRSLGNRSILANPLIKDMQKNLNLKIKYRESFRPFAPSVLKEFKDDWFDIKEESPYMLFISDIKKDKLIEIDEKQKNLSGFEKLNIVRSKIPAVTHVDNTARLQTVDKNINPVFHKLISKFYELSSCPLLVNTSFNIRGEPIVSSPKDAYKCFMGTELDVLVIENYLLIKNQQPERNKIQYKKDFDLD